MPSCKLLLTSSPAASAHRKRSELAGTASSPSIPQLSWRRHSQLGPCPGAPATLPASCARETVGGGRRRSRCWRCCVASSST
eukprot:767603-Hanusia_phi.AAC.6